MRYSVKIGTNAWLTDGDGDPPRTCLETSAQRFKSEKAAINRIKKVISSHPQRECLYYHILLDNVCLKTIETKFGQFLNTPQ